MVYLSLLLQLATLGLVVYVLLQLKSLFREVRVPAVRQKGQLPADFRDRLRNMPRPNAEAPKDRAESSEPRAERTEGRDRDRNRDGRDRDRNRDGRDRDRNREGRGEPRADREPRGDRPERSDRPEGRDRNRDGRDRDRNRDDRGPRPQRFDAAPVAESAPAPVVDAAPVASETRAPVASAAPAQSFGGRRPLGPVRSSAESAPVEESVSGALAPSSLAQPVAEAPIRHGRRSLPKAKPRFDDEPETVTESV